MSSASVSGRRKTDPRIKVKWAKENIGNLNSAIEDFFRKDPYEIIEKVDPQGGDKRHYFSIKRNIPDDIFCLTGDILHNLRSSLDHLLYRIMPDSVPWTRSHGFPVAQSAQEYKAKRSERRVKGLPNKLMHRIDAMQPYKGGNDALWALHELNIIDKHRLLLAVVIAQEKIQFDGLRSWLFGPFPGFVYRIREIISVKDGAEISPGRFDPKVDVKDQFTFVVAFDEPQIVKPEPVIPTLTQYVDLVEGIIAVFDDIP